MRRQIIRLLSIAFIALMGPSIAQALVPATPIFITNPPAGAFDAFFEVAPTPSGFVVAWNRSKGATISVLVQQFDLKGKAVPGKLAKVVAGPAVLGEAELLSLSPTTVAVFWAGGGNVRGSIFNLTTNTVGPAKNLGKTSDHIHDVALLSNGNIGIVTTQIDLSNPFNVRDKVSLIIASKTLGIVSAAKSVHGTGFKDVGRSYYDQTIVAKTNGGIVFFRDRANGAIMGRNFTNAGVLSGPLFKVNATSNPLGTQSDDVYSRIRAVRLGNGVIAVAWVSMESPGAAHYDVRSRMLSVAGAPVGSDFLVQAKAGAQFSPELVALPGNRFLVDWKYDNSTPSLVFNIMYRVYSSLGAPLFAPRVAEQLTIIDSLFGALQIEAALLADGSVVNVFGTYLSQRLRADGLTTANLKP